LHRIAGHVDSAFRLRYRPDLAVAAVLSPGGTFLDLEDASVGSTQRERLAARVIDVLCMAARGFTGKGIGYTLGLAPSSVSTALGSAAAKVGLRSRLALVDVAAAMFGARSAGAPVTALTSAPSRRGLAIARLP
jgi:DNA-binding NarL/FixJ family response regulator